jgi:metal-responsive CopG/Arc/MetJ family transcriptional regulator
VGRPPKDTDSLTLRLSREMIAAIDDMRRSEADLPNRQEMIRRILQAVIDKHTTYDKGGLD